MNYYLCVGVTPENRQVVALVVAPNDYKLPSWFRSKYQDVRLTGHHRLNVRKQPNMRFYCAANRPPMQALRFFLCVDQDQELLLQGQEANVHSAVPCGWFSCAEEDFRLLIAAAVKYKYLNPNGVYRPLGTTGVGVYANLVSQSAWIVVLFNENHHHDRYTACVTTVYQDSFFAKEPAAPLSLQHALAFS